MSTTTVTNPPSLDELTHGTQDRALPALAGAQLRAEQDGDAAGYEFTGIAVPWDTQIDIWGIREEFAPGSCVPDPNGVLVCWRHDDPIGRITRHEDAPEGWDVDGRISRTARGDEAATLLRDEVITRQSIRFTPEEYTVDDTGDVTVIRHTRAVVHEVSLVPFPAYQSATITEVRERTPAMGDTRTNPDTVLTPEEIAELREEVETLSRQMQMLGGARDNPALLPDQFRSFGDYVKKLAAGDEAAMRAFTGAVTDDAIVKDGWVGDVINLGNARQRITSLFTHTRDLPSEGNNVEYGKLLANTLQVGQQPGEGENLLYGKLSLTTDTAPVVTLGGWTEYSRQSVERATVSVLDFAFRAMFLKYARAVETLTRSVAAAAYADASGTALATVQADFTTQDGVVGGLVDLVEHFENADVNLDGILVSKDVFLQMLAIPSNDRILQVSRAPEDKVGTATITALRGDVAGVPVSLWPGAAAGTKMAYDSTAIHTQESPGAPMRLQDENIVNLSKAFSVYGYAASYAQVRHGLVKITDPA